VKFKLISSSSAQLFGDLLTAAAAEEWSPSMMRGGYTVCACDGILYYTMLLVKCEPESEEPEPEPMTQSVEALRRAERMYDNLLPPSPAI